MIEYGTPANLSVNSRSDMAVHASFWGGITESPCRRCKEREADGWIAETCIETCPTLNPPKQPIYAYTNNEAQIMASARTPTHDCIWPDCNDQTRGKYCDYHGPIVAQRKTFFKKKYGRKPPENYLYLPIHPAGSLIKKYQKIYGELP